DDVAETTSLFDPSILVSFSSISSLGLASLGLVDSDLLSIVHLPLVELNVADNSLVDISPLYHLNGDLATLDISYNSICLDGVDYDDGSALYDFFSGADASSNPPSITSSSQDTSSCGFCSSSETAGDGAGDPVIHCSDTSSAASLSSNTICRKVWDWTETVEADDGSGGVTTTTTSHEQWSVECNLYSYKVDNEDGSSSCVSYLDELDNYTPPDTFPSCVNSSMDNVNMECSSSAAVCIEGWNGARCEDECPLHYSNQLQCGGSEYGSCLIPSHTCECTLSPFYGDSCQYITIPDANLLFALCSAIDGYNSTCDLTESNLQGITTGAEEELSCLDLSSLDITDLSGLEYLTNISCIDLSGNTSLSDISVLDSLSEFNHLTALNISDTAVDDLTQISSLSGVLTSLSVANTDVLLSDIASIFGSYLTELDVSGMKLDDLLWLYEVDSASSSFTILFPMLEYLDASDNNISDPSPLFLLSSTLTALDLRVNNVCGMDDEEEVNAFVSVFTTPLSSLTSDGYSIFDDNVCLCTDDSISLSSNIVCSEIWPGEYSATCCSSCYTDVSSSSLSCVLIDDETASLYAMCSDLSLSGTNQKCIGMGSDVSSVSINDISIVCSEGWYGDDCLSECPVDEYGYECGNYDGTDTCDSETHTCTCSSSSSSPLMTGDLCEIESGVTLLSSLGMDVALVEAICESMYVDDVDVQSLCSSSSAENILSSLTVDDLSTITSLTIPTTVASLSGLEYAEHLEILSFEPGNTLISDLSPIASLSSLYVLELDSLENMDVSLLSTLTDAVGALKMDLESDTSRWNGTSESYCVGLCSLRSLEISGSDDSIGSDLSSFTSLLNNIAMCSGQCVGSYDDGTKVYPLSSTLTHLDL
ncbi:hypothetical protein ADUPG1_010173, partial [Aduncisulcus paluster]